MGMFSKEMGKTLGLGCADGADIVPLLVRYLEWTEDRRHGEVLDAIVSYALVEMSFKQADALYESILEHCGNLRIVIIKITSDLIHDLHDERASQLPLQLQKVCRFIEIFGAMCALHVDWDMYHSSKIKSTTLLAILNDAAEAAAQQDWYPVDLPHILLDIFPLDPQDAAAAAAHAPADDIYHLDLQDAAAAAVHAPADDIFHLDLQDAAAAAAHAPADDIFHLDLQDAVAAAARAPADNSIEEVLTEHSLEQALHQSEIEALQIEQAQLQQALVQSKADIPGVDVVLIQYSQSGRWFREALLNSAELQEERAVLEKASLSPQLPSGAKIFVAPEVYLTVVQHLEEQGRELKTSHVVVARDLEEKILSVVEAARASATKRERGGSCHVKVRDELNASTMATGSAEDGNMPLYFVKKTFVHVPIPSSMRTESSFHPASTP